VFWGEGRASKISEPGGGEVQLRNVNRTYRGERLVFGEFPLLEKPRAPSPSS